MSSPASCHSVCSWCASTAVGHAVLTPFSHLPLDLACSAGILGREASPAGVPLHRGRRDWARGSVQPRREPGEGENHAQSGESNVRKKSASIVAAVSVVAFALFTALLNQSRGGKSAVRRRLPPVWLRKCLSPSLWCLFANKEGRGRGSLHHSRTISEKSTRAQALPWTGRVSTCLRSSNGQPADEIGA